MPYRKNPTRLLYTDFSAVYVDSAKLNKIVYYANKYYIAKIDSEPYIELRIGSKLESGDYSDGYFAAKLVYKGQQVDGHKVYEGNGWIFHFGYLYQSPAVEPDPTIFYESAPAVHFSSIYINGSAVNRDETQKAWLSELKFDWIYECQTKLGKYTKQDKSAEIWIGTPSWKGQIKDYKGGSHEIILIKSNGAFRFQEISHPALAKCIPDVATWYILGKKDDINGYWQAETQNPKNEEDFTARFIKNSSNKEALDFPDIEFKWNGIIESDTVDFAYMCDIATWM